VKALLTDVVGAAFAATLGLSVLGCGDRPRETAVAHAAIGGEIVARVGDIDLPVSLVRAVAGERRITPAAAVTLLVDDALAAKGAEARQLERGTTVLFGKRVVLGRATIDHLRADARATPPTDAEVQALSVIHAAEVDTPETLIVVHAVVLRPKEANPQSEAEAKGVATAIAAAEADATDPADFMARAKAVPHRGVDVVVEQLDPFAASGHVAVAGSTATYDPRFVAAATTLTSPGATSAVVESSFGWHVIRLIERRAPNVVPFEERRRLFAEEVYANRGHESLEALEKQLREREPVSLVSGVDDVLAEALPAAHGKESSPTTPEVP
jgi:hypothetical protein